MHESAAKAVAAGNAVTERAVRHYEAAKTAVRDRTVPWRLHMSLTGTGTGAGSNRSR